MSAPKAPPRPALGRGLTALLSTPKPPEGSAAGPYLEVEPSRIDAWEAQPRKQFDVDALNELAESIRSSGVLQPLVVRRGKGDRFELIAGERRLRAAVLARVERVPVIVREVADDQRFVLALVENIQRRDLNPVEEAEAYQRLIEDHAMTHEELSRRVGRGRPTISNALRLLQLPRAVRELVADSTLSAGHARAVLAVDEPWRQLVAERMVTDNLSVRDAEELARVVRETGRMPGTAAAAPPAARPSRGPTAEAARPLRPQLKLIQGRLQDRLGARVRIEDSGGSGQIVVEYADAAGLQALVDLLLGDG